MVWMHYGFAATSRALSDADLALIDEIAAGLPFYTQMAASLLWQYGDHAQTKGARCEGRGARGEGA